MSDRSLRALVALGLVLAGSAVTADAAAAGKKDKEALKLHDQAMDEDYLSVEFDKAAEKLDKALASCGASDCSPEVVGKLHIALGTVHGVGQGKLDVSLEDFKKALAADPNAKLIEGLTTPELEEKFKEAKGGAAAPPDGETPPPPSEDGEAGGDFPHEPVAEQAINTPVPVYVKIPDDLGATKVVVRYKPFGGDKWKSVNLERMGAGFGGNIPCADVTTTGEIRYHIIATDGSDSPVATAGSTKRPYKVQIKQRLENEAPSLPGQDPPKKCVAKEDCPPGLPGCEPAGGASGPRGDKGWGASCEATPECTSGLVCLNGTCEEGSDDGSGTDKPSKGAKNLVSLGVQFDLLLLSSAEQVCSPENGDAYACFESGSSSQFYGLPDTVAETNGIKGGVALAGVRILAGYERLLLDGLGLAVGARVGVAFGGSPSPDNDPPTCREQLEGGVCDEDSTELGYAPAGKARGFLPLHLEGRVSYYFLNEGHVAKDGLYPYAFVGGGIAQVNASVPVAVCDVATGEAGNGCPDSTELDAYQLSGLGFIGFGGGATYMFHENVGAQAELKMMFMVPTTGFVVAPSVGPVFAF